MARTWPGPWWSPGSRTQPGDDVYGTCEGSFAQYVAASENKIAVKPANLTFAQAATVPIAGTTALQAVRDAGQVRAGQTVVIVGAAGGVGSFAVQIARALGAHVTGVCSTGQVDFVRSIGADVIIVFGGGDRFLDSDASSRRRERSSSVAARAVASGSAVGAD